MAESESTIKVCIKTAQKQKYDNSSSMGTVKVFKKSLSTLSFAGRISKDAETLKSHGIKDGVNVHLVVKSTGKVAASAAYKTPTATLNAPTAAARTSTSSSTSTTPTTTTAAAATDSRSNSANTAPPPPAPGSAGGLFGMLGNMPGFPLGGAGGGGGNMASQMAAVQQQLLQNPEMMRQMMKSPLIQNMLSNPEALRNMFTSNQQMQEPMEQHPKLNHVLNNPDLMKQALKMARNPAAFQEMLRSQDRQLSNIEKLKWYGNGNVSAPPLPPPVHVPAPPPPPPVSTRGPPVPPSQSNKPSSNLPVVSDARANLMESIRAAAGKTLHKVEEQPPAEKKQPEKKQPESVEIAGALARALESRKDAFADSDSDENDKYEEDDEDWSD